jgi:hypothetical protein
VKVHAAVVIALVSGAGCERPLPVEPLPAMQPGQPERRLVSPRDALVVARERMSWSVTWRGLPVGAIQWASGSGDRVVAIESEFHTSGVAANMARIEHRLATRVDAVSGGPIDGVDTIVDGGAAHTTRISFSHERWRGAHTLHSAVAAVRGWASDATASGYLFVVHQGLRYRLDVARPEVDMVDGASALRIEAELARVDGRGEPVAITLWLSGKPWQIPMRLEVEQDGNTATAELIERTVDR